MAVSLLVKRFEVEFIKQAKRSYSPRLHSNEETVNSLMEKLRNMDRARLRLTDTEGAALCEILLEVETEEAPRSETEVMLAKELLDRIELPNNWQDPFSFAKTVATAPESVIAEEYDSADDDITPTQTVGERQAKIGEPHSQL